MDEPLGFEGYNASGGPGTGTERAMFADRQGSVIWVTEPATGDVVAAYEYDGDGQITQTQGSLSQPYGYTGREYTKQQKKLVWETLTFLDDTLGFDFIDSEEGWEKTEWLQLCKSITGA